MPVAKYRILKIKGLYFNGEFIMRKHIIKKRTIEYIRINRSEARTYYNNGYSIFLTTSKANHNDIHAKFDRIRKRYDSAIGFNIKVANFEKNNCNEKNGKYAKYFIRLREKEETTYETTKKIGKRNKVTH